MSPTMRTIQWRVDIREIDRQGKQLTSCGLYVSAEDQAGAISQARRHYRKNMDAHPNRHRLSLRPRVVCD